MYAVLNNNGTWYGTARKPLINLGYLRCDDLPLIIKNKTLLNRVVRNLIISGAKNSDTNLAEALKFYKEVYQEPTKSILYKNEDITPQVFVRTKNGAKRTLSADLVQTR